MLCIKPINIILLAGGMLAAGCAPEGRAVTPSPALISPQPGQLTPYLSPSPTATATPPDPSTPTPLPSPTATPRTHVVKKGEDLSGLALQYRIPLEEIIAANPTVNPRAMSVGTVLVIPLSKTPEPTQPSDGKSALQTPTAVPVEAQPVSCTRVQDGGVWCFQLVRNPQSFPLEGLTAVFRLSGSQEGAPLTQTAFLPLDTLPPGASLPLAAYFPPAQAAALAAPLRASSEIIAALPNPDDGRYLQGHVENMKVLLSPDGLSAAVSFTVMLDTADSQAQRVWAAAVAYDENGRVVGVRRWEKKEGPPLASGQGEPVQMNLFSISGPIAKVEILPEIRP